MCNCAYLVLPFIITSMFFNVLVLSWCQTQMHQFLLILCDQVTSYAHGSSDLLGIQIDAAINPGALYNKLCFYLFVLLLCQFSYFSSQICSCLKLQTFCFLNDVFPLSLSFFEPYLILPQILGNSGGPAFNDQGECIGVAFLVNISACCYIFCCAFRWPSQRSCNMCFILNRILYNLLLQRQYWSLFFSSLFFFPSIFFVYKSFFVDLLT